MAEVFNESDPQSILRKYGIGETAIPGPGPGAGPENLPPVSSVQEIMAKYGIEGERPFTPKEIVPAAPKFGEGENLYDYEAAKGAGITPDETGHWPSRVGGGEQEGLLLKHETHPTFFKTLEGEKEIGNQVYRSPEGRLFSFPQEQPAPQGFIPYEAVTTPTPKVPAQVAAPEEIVKKYGIGEPAAPGALAPLPGAPAPEVTPGVPAPAPAPAGEPGLAELALRGFKHGVSGMGEYAGTAMRALGHITRITSLKETGKEWENYYGQVSKSLEAPPEVAKTYWDDPKQIFNISKLAYGVGDMIPGMATAIAAGVGVAVGMGVTAPVGIAGAAFFTARALFAGKLVGGVVGGTLEGASAYREILERGGTENQALAAGTAMSLAAGVLNYISFGTMTGEAGAKALRAFIATGDKQALKQLGKYLGTASATEAITEYLEEPSEGVIKKFLIPDKYSWEEFANQLKGGFDVMGPSFLLGGVGGAGGAIAQQPRPSTLTGAKRLDDYFKSLTLDLEAQAAENRIRTEYGGGKGVVIGEAIPEVRITDQFGRPATADDVQAAIQKQPFARNAREKFLADQAQKEVRETILPPGVRPSKIIPGIGPQERAMVAEAAIERLQRAVDIVGNTTAGRELSDILAVNQGDLANAFRVSDRAPGIPEITDRIVELAYKVEDTGDPLAARELNDFIKSNLGALKGLPRWPIGATIPPPVAPPAPRLPAQPIGVAGTEKISPVEAGRIRVQQAMGRPSPPMEVAGTEKEKGITEAPPAEIKLPEGAGRMSFEDIFKIMGEEPKYSLKEPDKHPETIEDIKIVKTVKGQPPSLSMRGSDVFRVPAQYEVQQGGKPIATITSSSKRMGYRDVAQWELRLVDSNRVKYFPSLKEAKEAALRGELPTVAAETKFSLKEGGAPTWKDRVIAAHRAEIERMIKAGEMTPQEAVDLHGKTHLDLAKYLVPPGALAAPGVTPPGVMPPEARDFLKKFGAQVGKPEGLLTKPPIGLAPNIDPVATGFQPASEAPGSLPSYARFPVEQLGRDPATFQHKREADLTTGVSGTLEGIKWQEARAGELGVFETMDGRFVVAHGHNRLWLAENNNIPTLKIKVYREADGWTPPRVKQEAFMDNLADGKLDALDIGQFLRETGATEADLKDWISLKSKDAQVGLGLSTLSPRIWDDVYRGVWGTHPDKDSAALGAIVGRGLKDNPAAQEALYQRIIERQNQGKDTTPAQLRYLVESGKLALVEADTQINLFGEETVQASRMFERASVATYIEDALSMDKTVLAYANRERARLESVEGTRINEEGNRLIAAQAKEALGVFKKVSKTEGTETYRFLNDFAERLAQAKNEGEENAIKKEALANLNSALSKDFATLNQEFRGRPEGGEVAPREGPGEPGGAPLLSLKENLDTYSEKVRPTGFNLKASRAGKNLYVDYLQIDDPMKARGALRAILEKAWDVDAENIYFHPEDENLSPGAKRSMTEIADAVGAEQVRGELTRKIPVKKLEDYLGITRAKQKTWWKDTLQGWRTDREIYFSSAIDAERRATREGYQYSDQARRHAEGLLNKAIELDEFITKMAKKYGVETPKTLYSLKEDGTVGLWGGERPLTKFEKRLNGIITQYPAVDPQKVAQALRALPKSSDREIAALSGMRAEEVSGIARGTMTVMERAELARRSGIPGAAMLPGMEPAGGLFGEQAPVRVPAGVRQEVAYVPEEAKGPAPEVAPREPKIRLGALSETGEGRARQLADLESRRREAIDGNLIDPGERTIWDSGIIPASEAFVESPEAKGILDVAGKRTDIREVIFIGESEYFDAALFPEADGKYTLLVSEITERGTHGQVSGHEFFHLDDKAENPRAIRLINNIDTNSYAYKAYRNIVNRLRDSADMAPLSEREMMSEVGADLSAGLTRVDVFGEEINLHEVFRDPTEGRAALADYRGEEALPKAMEKVMGGKETIRPPTFEVDPSKLKFNRKGVAKRPFDSLIGYDKDGNPVYGWRQSGSLGIREPAWMVEVEGKPGLRRRISEEAAARDYAASLIDYQKTIGEEFPTDIFRRKDEFDHLKTAPPWEAIGKVGKRTLTREPLFALKPGEELQERQPLPPGIIGGRGLRPQSPERTLLQRFMPGYETYQNIKQGILSLLLPTAKTPEHLQAAEITGSHLGPMNRSAEIFAKKFKADSRMFAKMGVYNPDIPFAENPGPKFISDIMQGRSLSSELQPTADRINDGNLNRLRRLEAVGAPIETVRVNYFGLIWTKDSIRAFNQALREAIGEGRGLAAGEGGLGQQVINLNDWSAPDKAFVKARTQELLQNKEGSDTSALEYLARRPFKGSEGFRKPKVFDDVMTGGEFGLELVSNNPIDIVKLKFAEMDRSIMANGNIQEEKANGNIKFNHVSKRTPKGWKRINDKYGTVYGPYDPKTGSRPIYGYNIAKTPVADILNNYLSSSLYNNPYFGEAFKWYQGFGNLLNQIQLGVGSFFHAGFTSLETQISTHSMVLKDIYGVVVKGNRTFGQLGNTLKQVPAAMVRTAMDGNKILAEWNNPTMEVPTNVPVGQLNTSNEAGIAMVAKAAELAGGGFTMERGLRTRQTEVMLKDWFAGKKLKAALRTPTAFIEASIYPTLDFLVPRQKAGIFSYYVGRILEQNPTKTLEELVPDLRQAWNRTDARLGQVRYSRLFLNNTAKNFIQALIRAPGWTGGTIAEVGGGFKDTAKFLSEWIRTGKAPAELPDRVAYTLSLMGTIAVANGLLTYALTGEPPKGIDWWAFRDGGTDEQGNPTRWLFPSYVKDIFAYGKAPGHVLLAKTHPLLSLIGDIAKNKTYYGEEIANPEDNFISRQIDRGEFTLKYFTPFWISGAAKAAERGGGLTKTMREAPQKLIAPLGGVMPATRAYTATEAQQVIDEYQKLNRPQLTTKQIGEEKQLKRELRKFAQAGDESGFKEAADSAISEGHLTRQQIKTIVEESQAPPGLGRFIALPVEWQVRAWNKANQNEKETWQPYFLKKVMAAKPEILIRNRETLDPVLREMGLDDAADAIRDLTITEKGRKVDLTALGIRKPEPVMAGMEQVGTAMARAIKERAEKMGEEKVKKPSLALVKEKKRPYGVLGIQ